MSKYGILWYAVTIQVSQKRWCIIEYFTIISIGPIPMMVGAELFRQGPRAIAMAVAGVTNWVFTFVVAMGFEGVAVSVL